MSSFEGCDGTRESRSSDSGVDSGGVATLLFESLVHQLIEKGVLTRNDALSIVQTVAQVKQGQLGEERIVSPANAELTLLRRLYESFEALRDRSSAAMANLENVRQLRPPLHGNAPEFPVQD